MVKPSGEGREGAFSPLSKSSSSNRRGSKRSSRSRSKGSRHKTAPSVPASPSNESILSSSSPKSALEARYRAVQGSIAELMKEAAQLRQWLGETPALPKAPSGPIICNADSQKLAKRYAEAGTLRIKGNPDMEREAVHRAVMADFAIHDARGDVSTCGKDVELGIMTTAPVESYMVISQLKNPTHVELDGGWHFYIGHWGPSDSKGVKAVVVKSDQGSGGLHGSQNAAVKVGEVFGVRLLMAVGIAWGADVETQWYGDVLVSTYVQPYDHARQSASGTRTLMQPIAPLDPKIKKRVQEVESWKAPVADKEGTPDGKPRPAKAHPGAVVSASVLLDNVEALEEVKKDVNEVLKDPNAVPRLPKSLKLVGGEMEGAGLISASGLTGAPWLICKGVSDFARDKNKGHQPFAVLSAIAWSQAFVGSGEWIADLPLPEQSTLRLHSAAAFVADKTRNFVGRRELFSRVHEWRKQESGSKGRVVIVKGSPGIGKSAWAAALSSFPEHKPFVAAAHFCRYDDPESLRGRVWLGSVVKQILGWAQSAGVRIPQAAIKPVLDIKLPVPDAFQGFLEALPAHVDSEPVLIIVDSLDEAHDVGGADGDSIIAALSKAASVLPSWLKVVATSRDEEAVLGQLRASIGSVEMKSSDAENKKDLELYVTKSLPNFSQSKINEVLKAAEGNFMYTRQLLDYGAAGDVTALLARDAALPTGLFEMYDAMALRLFPTKEEFQEVLPVLNVLVAAKGPLPRDLFDAAVKAGGLTLNLGAVLSDLRSVLEVNGAIARIYHKSFGDWLSSRGWKPKGAASRASVRTFAASGHASLASACAASRMSSKPSSYGKEHMIEHAVRSGGHGPALRAVVEALGGDVNARAGPLVIGWTDERMTLLEGAAAAGEEGVLAWLVTPTSKGGGGAKGFIESKSPRTKRTPFWFAAATGQLGAVQWFVEVAKIKSVDAADGIGKTPLAQACSAGHLDVVKYLLTKAKSKAVDTLDEQERSPLWLAARNGHLDIVKELVATGKTKRVDDADKNYRRPPVWAAAMEGHTSVVAWLITSGGAKTMDAFHFDGATSVWITAHYGHLETLKWLLEKGKSKAAGTPDVKGRTPVWSAATTGNVNTLEYLLGPGGRASDIDRPDENGNTPMAAAANAGHKDAVAALIKAGSKAIDKGNNDGVTPLAAAAGWGQLPVIKYLLEVAKSKALDQADNRGKTPLYYAASGNNLKTVRYLVEEAGSKSLNVKDKSGKRPVDIAVEKGNMDVFRYLMRCNAELEKQK